MTVAFPRVTASGTGARTYRGDSIDQNFDTYSVEYTFGDGAKMMLEGRWKRTGVWNMEEFDPDPFMDDLNKHGLPWTVVEL